MGRVTSSSQRQQPAERASAQDARHHVFTMKAPKRIAARLKDLAEHSERGHDPYRSAMSMLTGHMSRAAAQYGPDEKKRLEKAKDELKTLFQRPSTGRTSSLGRKVEKPAPSRSGGPSGQTDAVQHEKKHANK